MPKSMRFLLGLTSRKMFVLLNIGLMLLNLYTFHKLTRSKPDMIEASNNFTSKYLQNSKEERPLFIFHQRPWKSEKTIKSNFDPNCKVNNDIFEWSLIFVVKSAVHNINRRNMIRSTWGKVKIFDMVRFETMFVLGQTTDETMSNEIKKENLQHGDILQYNAPDTAQFVPEKVLAGMQWASDLPSNWFYSSIDDDVSVNLANLANYLHELMPKYPEDNGKTDFKSIPIICFYNYQNRDLPSRNPNSKWYISTADYPLPYWPVYCRGGMYTVNSQMLNKLYLISRRTARLYLDDVWITGFMRLKLGQGDNNILAAPWSVKPDTDYIEDLDFNKLVVKHFWGNIAQKKADIPTLLSKVWEDHKPKFENRINCEI